MFFKRKPKKQEPVRITKEQFGDYVLSKFILKSGEKVDDFFNEFNKEGNVSDYMTYLQYHLFLTQKILETRHSKDDSTKMVLSAINGIVDMLSFFPNENKEKAKEVFKNKYSDFVEGFDADITNEHDMHELTKSFLKEWKVEDIFQNHQYVFATFMLFVKYHTNSILTNAFELI